MARLGASKTKKSPRATALSQLKKELKRVTNSLSLAIASSDNATQNCGSIGASERNG